MIGETITAKIAGIISGALLALLLDPPRSRKGFARRTAAALIFGYIFGGVALAFLGWTPNYDNTVAAFCLASFLSWGAMGRLKKFIESYKKET